jgi:hypothetical protein
MVQWFSRGKISDLAKYLHFYDYLSFEVHLALYLNNLEFPLPKSDM